MVIPSLVVGVLLAASLPGVASTQAATVWGGVAPNWAVQIAPSARARVAPIRRGPHRPVGFTSVGMTFTVPAAGTISALRFSRPDAVDDPVTGSLWSADGTLLGEATFAASPDAGWQQASLDTPVQVDSGQSYVASYATRGSLYSVTPEAFATAHEQSGVSVPAWAGRISMNRRTIEMPSTPSASNYLVDVVYAASDTPSASPSATDTPSAAPSATATPSESPSATATPSETPSATDTPSATPSQTTTAPSTTTFYVDPQRQTILDKATNDTERALLEKIADQPTSEWITGDTWDADTLTRVTADSKAKGTTPIAAFYNIPNRDCGNYAWGGATDGASYIEWAKKMAALTEGRYWIILEPDALALSDCTPGTLSWLHDAGVILKAAGNKVYLDIGNSRWLTPDVAAAKIKAVGADAFDGVSLNVSNYETTADSRAYMAQVSAAYGSTLHFVVDTSRNGNGPTADHQWCNARGRALGDKPQILNASDGLDAELWVKPPGDSDGPCNGGPTSGGIWLEIALELAGNAHW